MKLPRWLVVGLLTVSALTLLGTTGWWWMTWPERTARRFVHLMDSRDFEDANRMILVDPRDDNLSFATYYYENDWDGIDCLRRSPADRLFGRGRYSVTSTSIRFNVVRGRVIAKGYVSWDDTGYQFSPD
jgi:hypothetical protein